MQDWFAQYCLTHMHTHAREHAIWILPLPSFILFFFKQNNAVWVWSKCWKRKKIIWCEIIDVVAVKFKIWVLSLCYCRKPDETQSFWYLVAYAIQWFNENNLSESVWCWYAKYKASLAFNTKCSQSFIYPSRLICLRVYEVIYSCN